MQQNNGFRRCRRAIAALAGASLVAAALTVSNLPQAAAAPSEPVVHDHGVPGLADIYNGTTASPDGGTYNVGYQVVSDTNRAVLVTKSKADGSLDTAFGTDGRAVIDLVKTFHETVTTNPGAKEVARGVTVDKLGRILVVGEVEGDQSSAATASDTDVFVARVHPNGNLDTSYGTHGGWTRINLSDGIHPTGGTNAADAAGYDIFVRPNQKAIFSAAIGTDSNGTRTARDAAAVQLSPTASSTRPSARTASPRSRPRSATTCVAACSKRMGRTSPPRTPPSVPAISPSSASSTRPARPTRAGATTVSPPPIRVDWAASPRPTASRRTAWATT